MKVRLACVTLSWMLLNVVAPAVFAQSIQRDIEKAANEAVEEAKLAASEAVSPERMEEERRIDSRVIDNAMRQIAVSHDRSIANELPLPDYVGPDAIRAALAHENAWEASSAETHHNNTALIDAMVGLSFDAGHLMWAEWACDNSRMQGVATQYIDIVDSLVTVYPERLLLQSALTSRRAIGYPFDTKCDRQFLEFSRSSYQESLSSVLDLSASVGD